MIDLGHGFRAGDIIHFDPFALPELKIITKEEADKIADSFPKHQFIVSWEKEEFKSFTDYVRKHKR